MTKAKDHPTQPATGVLSNLSGLMERHHAEGVMTTLADVVEALGEKGHLALILLAALLAMTPLSGIPGLSSCCGIIITLAAAQALAGRRTLWLPERLQRLRLPADKQRTAARWVRKSARIVEGSTAPRLELLVGGLVRRVFLAIFALCGLLMPVLEFIPFSASIVATVIVVFSVILLRRDGMMMALGLGVPALATTFVMIGTG